MKKALKCTWIILLSTIIAVFIVWLMYYAVYETAPLKWQIQGHDVTDTSVYTGTYFQVNDSIRLIPEKFETKLFGHIDRFDKVALYEKKNGKYIKTKHYEYPDILDGKWRVILRLQSSYEKQKRKKT